MLPDRQLSMQIKLHKRQTTEIVNPSCCHSLLWFLYTSICPIIANRENTVKRPALCDDLYPERYIPRHNTHASPQVSICICKKTAYKHNRITPRAAIRLLQSPQNKIPDDAYRHTIRDFDVLTGLFQLFQIYTDRVLFSVPSASSPPRLAGFCLRYSGQTKIR